jgi:hypothetical protein
VCSDVILIILTKNTTNEMKLKDNKIAPLTNNDRVVEIPEISNASAKNQTSALVLEFIGWAGSVLVLIPYIVVFEKSIDFALNTAGASGLLIICIKTRQAQSIVINSAWIVGGIYKYFCN